MKLLLALLFLLLLVGCALIGRSRLSRWRPDNSGPEPLMGLMQLQVLSPALCGQIINIAEQQNWQTTRHENYPTTDIATCTVPSLELALLDVNERIMHAACRRFGFEQGELWLRDQFVVKYDPSAQSKLVPHKDASPISYVLALNDAYTGGGTSFQGTTPSKLQVGQVLVFSGKRLHEGLPTTSGTRYIVTGFLDAHASPQTAHAVRRANKQCLGRWVDDIDWRPTIPTRPYLRSNTYRLLGADAQRGDSSKLLDMALMQQRWPFADLRSLYIAAQKIRERYGSEALGELRFHQLFHHLLTDSSECQVYCHPAS